MEDKKDIILSKVKEIKDITDYDKDGYGDIHEYEYEDHGMFESYRTEMYAFKDLVMDNKLKNDRDFAIKLINIDPLSIKYFSNDIKCDRHIIKIALMKSIYDVLYNLSTNFKAIKTIFNDKEIAKILIKQYPGTLKYLHNELRNDKELLELAYNNNGNSLLYASQNIIEDKDFMLKACTFNSGNAQWLSSKLCNDQKFIDILLENNEACCEHIFRKNTELLKLDKYKYYNEIYRSRFGFSLSHRLLFAENFSVCKELPLNKDFIFLFSSVIRDIKCNYNEHNNRLGISGSDLFDIGDY